MGGEQRTAEEPGVGKGAYRDKRKRDGRPPSKKNSPLMHMPGIATLAGIKTVLQGYEVHTTSAEVGLRGLVYIHTDKGPMEAWLHQIGGQRANVGYIRTQRTYLNVYWWETEEGRDMGGPGMVRGGSGAHRDGKGTRGAYMYSYRGAGTAQRLDSLAGSPPGNAYLRHMLASFMICPSKSHAGVTHHMRSGEHKFE